MALLFGACNGSENGTGSTTSETSPGRSTAECAVSPPGASTTSIDRDCVGAGFLEALRRQASSRATSALSYEQAISFGEGVCAYARELAASDASVPFAEFVAATARSWNVDTSVVVDVVASAHVLCPSESDVIESLRDAKLDSVRLELAVEGGTEARIEHPTGGGASIVETLETPWRGELEVTSATAIRLFAEPSDDGRITCAIRLGKRQLAKEVGDRGEAVQCEVAAAKVAEVLSPAS